MNELRKRLLAISDFSLHYTKMCEKQKKGLEITSWGMLLNDWWRALIFFFDRAFYQGRKDVLSSAFESAAIKAIEDVLGTSNDIRTVKLWKLYNEGFLAKQNWDRRDNVLNNALKRKYEVDGKLRGTGKQGDRRMVINTFEFICDKAPPKKVPLNLVQYITENVRKKKLPLLAEELDAIWQIGPKIYSLILRDTIDFFELNKFVSPADFKYLQPVDTWVEQLAEKLGINGNKSQISEKLVEVCNKNNVNPIKFNQGAWYLASHSFEIVCDNLERLRPCQ
jgi:hypothetical protein